MGNNKDLNLSIMHKLSLFENSEHAEQLISSKIVITGGGLKKQK